MKCQSVQNLILALPDPRELSPELAEHVAGCAACQAWAKQAARIETMIAQLPVPPAPSDKKSALIGELMQAEPVILPMPVPAQRPSFAIVAARFVAHNGKAFAGLAAAVLVVVGIAWWANRPTTPRQEVVETQKHPFLDKLVARDIALARADTPAKRLELLSGMADDLATETRGMARIASAAELTDFARWYEKVVTKGVVQQAKEMPVHAMTPAEKRKLFESLATKLDTDATEAEKLSREVPQDAQPTLKRMADTAREGEKSLRALAREGK